TYDYDEDDQLKYEWTFENGKAGSTESNPTYTFKNKGIYKVVLKVTDPKGLSSTDTIEIKAGNTMPQVNINTNGNSTFYFANTSLDYTVDVQDKEDASIDANGIKVKLEYISKDAGYYKNINGNGTWIM